MKDLIQAIRENVTGSIKTTIFGIIIFLAGLVAFFWTDLGFGFWPPIELMVLGVVLACLKDPRKRHKTTNTTGRKDGGETAPLIAILIALTVSSCATERRCSERFGTSSNSDSVRIEVREVVRDTIIRVPGDSVEIYISNPCDSSGNLVPGIYHAEGSNGRASGMIEITSSGISVECQCEEENQIIKGLHREVNRLHHQKSETKVVYRQKESFWKKVGISITALLIGFILGRLSKYSK